VGRFLEHGVCIYINGRIKMKVATVKGQKHVGGLAVIKRKTCMLIYVCLFGCEQSCLTGEIVIVIFIEHSSFSLIHGQLVTNHTP